MLSLKIYLRKQDLNSLRQGAQLGSDCCFTWNLCKISSYDRRGFFWRGDKVEGSIQNVENYGVINKYKVLRAGAQIHIICFFKQVQSTNSWCPNLYGQSEQTLTKIWKTKWPPNHKIEHNSLISWQNFEKQNGRQITKLSITRSFLELQSPDFAWKFVWTKFWKTKWPPKNKMPPKSQD